MQTWLTFETTLAAPPVAERLRSSHSSQPESLNGVSLSVAAVHAARPSRSRPAAWPGGRTRLPRRQRARAARARRSALRLGRTSRSDVPVMEPSAEQILKTRRCDLRNPRTNFENKNKRSEQKSQRCSLFPVPCRRSSFGEKKHNLFDCFVCFVPKDHPHKPRPQQEHQ